MEAGDGASTRDVTRLGSQAGFAKHMGAGDAANTQKAATKALKVGRLFVCVMEAGSDAFTKAATKERKAVQLFV